MGPISQQIIAAQEQVAVARRALARFEAAQSRTRSPIDREEQARLLDAIEAAEDEVSRLVRARRARAVEMGIEILVRS